MKIKATENYYDMEKRKQILIGDVYEVTQKRAKVICEERKLAKIVREKKKDGESSES